MYELTSTQGPGEKEPVPAEPADPPEPLVLWCREGERVVVELTNDLPEGLEPEPAAPEVPVERDDRPVSRHVSLHADLVEYDVVADDGANVGHNPPQSVPPGETRSYQWDTHRPETSDPGGPLGPVLLQDIADVRNHRHHGLVGALVILSDDATAHEVGPGEATAAPDAPERWYGARVTVRRAGGGDGPGEETEEMVALLQDGLRLFQNGNTRFPFPTRPRSHPARPRSRTRARRASTTAASRSGSSTPWAARTCSVTRPGHPVWHVPAGHRVRFHLVGALDKPRNYSFTIHGVTWPEHRFLPPSGERPIVASESAISCGTVRTFEFTPAHDGDHAYRSGALRWAVSQGMWGILRVE